jgi:hypothetical protein
MVFSNTYETAISQILFFIIAGMLASNVMCVNPWIYGIRFRKFYLKFDFTNYFLKINNHIIFFEDFNINCKNLKITI